MRQRDRERHKGRIREKGREREIERRRLNLQLSIYYIHYKLISNTQDHFNIIQTIIIMLKLVEPEKKYP